MDPNRFDTPDGTYLDRLVERDGTVTDFGWRSNIIVDQCRELLAAFMKGDRPRGITVLALGRGDASWDTATPPAPEATTTGLVDDSPVLFPVTRPELEIDYLDDAGAIVRRLTNRIQLTATLRPGSFPIGAGDTFPLREFGLFGRIRRTDLMIDYVRHPVINIADDATFERRIRLVF